MMTPGLAGPSYARRQLWAALFLMLLWTACAERKPDMIPPPTAPSPPSAVKVPGQKVPTRPATLHDTKPAPKAPEPEAPLLLSPAIADERKDKMENEVTTKIRHTEQLVATVDFKHLSTQQSETFATIQAFLSKAKEALQENDMPRALNLAEKAQALAQDLPNSSGK